MSVFCVCVWGSFGHDGTIFVDSNLFVVRDDFQRFRSSNFIVVVVFDIVLIKMAFHVTECHHDEGRTRRRKKRLTTIAYVYRRRLYPNRAEKIQQTQSPKNENMWSRRRQATSQPTKSTVHATPEMRQGTEYGTGININLIWFIYYREEKKTNFRWKRRVYRPPPLRWCLCAAI